MKYFVCNCFYELKRGCGVIKSLIAEDFIDFRYLILKMTAITSTVRKQLDFCLIVIAILFFTVVVQLLITLSLVLKWLSLLMKIFAKSVKKLCFFILAVS